MSPYTKLAVRSLGPTKAVTLEEHRDIPTYVPNSPSRGTRRRGAGPKPQPGPWQERALCRGQGNKYGNVWMYPDLHPRWVAKAAAATCATCPVIEQCKAEKFGFGISAGVIRYSEPANRLAPPPTPVPTKVAVKVCGCGKEFTGPKAHCSRECVERVLAEIAARRERFSALSTKPLLKMLAPMTGLRIAELCGVSTRTVFRWKQGATVTLRQAERIANRLGVDVESLWPETCVSLSTGEQVRGSLAREEADRLRRPAPLSDTPIAPEAPVSNVRHLPAPVKLSRG